MIPKNLLAIIAPHGLEAVAKTIGGKLATTRMQRDLKIATLANASGIDQAVITELEAGNISVWKQTGIPLDSLLNRICCTMCSTIDEVVPTLAADKLTPKQRALILTTREDRWFFAPGQAHEDKQIQVYAFFTLLRCLSTWEKSAVAA